jgi:glycosyltransferase involved in cell wall biosynthesis
MQVLRSGYADGWSQLDHDEGDVVVDTLTDTQSVVAPSSRIGDVAIVHDYLTQRGGAERVVLAMSRTFPSSTIHTSVYEPEATYPEFADRQIDTSSLQRISMVRRDHRMALPVYPLTFGRLNIDAKVVICSTSGWAHGISTDGAKLLYVYNPARWLYRSREYVRGAPWWQKVALGAVRHPMRRWDHRAAQGSDRILAISDVVQERIRQCWGLDSTVVHPPHGVDPSGIQEDVPGVDAGYLLCVARLVTYKHIDAIVEAMQNLPNDRLIVVGEGPLRQKLQAVAPRNVQFMGRVSDAQLRWLYANARLLVAAAIDDFGLAPVEAMAFGTASVALRAAGYLETVIEGETGIFFDRPDPSSIVSAVGEADRTPWGETRIRGHADLYSEESFATNMRAAVSALS